MLIGVQIDPSGLVAQCGDIQEGNKIVSINGRAATKMSMHEAVSLLQQLFVDKLPLTLEVTDPEPGTTYCHDWLHIAY